MSSTKVNPDLAIERTTNTFSPHQLAIWLRGGEAAVKRRNQLADLIEVRI
jgi:hypothetical protein